MSTGSMAPPDLATRRAPGLGGFNLTVLRLEIRRLLRNRRTVLFTMVLPVFFFLLFGLNSSYADDRYHRGNISAQVLIKLALYGAVLATTSGGTTVSIERAQGWSRQLRLTPLSPVAYIFLKMLTAMVLGLSSLTAVYLVGGITGKPDMPVWVWVTTALCVWIGSLVFAAFGLFMGDMLTTENVMQFLGFALGILAFAGGLFIPLSQFPQLYQDIAEYTPLYGLNELVHAPLGGVGVQLAWAANAVIWLAIFAGGAVWRFRKDTARV
jgi:ABC-2 type transport system permease protein